jgi:hypothetical protein
VTSSGTSHPNSGTFFQLKKQKAAKKQQKKVYEREGTTELSPVCSSETALTEELRNFTSRRRQHHHKHLTAPVSCGSHASLARSLAHSLAYPLTRLLRPGLTTLQAHYLLHLHTMSDDRNPNMHPWQMPQAFNGGTDIMDR